MRLDELIIYQYGRIEYELTKIKGNLTEYKDGKQKRREKRKQLSKKKL